MHYCHAIFNRRKRKRNVGINFQAFWIDLSHHLRVYLLYTIQRISFAWMSTNWTIVPKECFVFKTRTKIFLFTITQTCQPVCFLTIDKVDLRGWNGHYLILESFMPHPNIKCARFREKLWLLSVQLASLQVYLDWPSFHFRCCLKLSHPVKHIHHESICPNCWQEKKKRKLTRGREYCWLFEGEKATAHRRCTSVFSRTESRIARSFHIPF